MIIVLFIGLGFISFLSMILENEVNKELIKVKAEKKHKEALYKLKLELLLK